MTRKLSIALTFAVFLALLIPLLAANVAAPNPQEAARLNNIGVAYMNQQLFEKALKSFEEAAEKDPALEVTTVNRGVALLNLQRVDDAKTLLEKAAKDNPKDAHAWYNLGLYYKNSADASSAVDAFRRVTEIDPADADTWYFLGSTYAQAKQFPQAIDAFEHALKLDAHHASAEFGLARAYQQSGQSDPAHEAMKKFQYITQNKLGSPISLAYGEQGKYSRAEESPLAVEKVGAAIPVKFVDVTAQAGIRGNASPRRPGKYPKATELSPGACFLDYDGDGLIDLLVADNGPTGGLGLFHNLGNGKFEDVTKKAGLDPTQVGNSCTTGDYDNDGAVDIALGFNGRVELLHNEKNGTFKDVTEKAGINSDHFNTGLAFIDYDHDGDLDLYVTESTPPVIADTEEIEEFESKPSQPDSILHGDGDPGNRLWRNNGNGTFSDVTENAGVSSPASSTAAVGTDFNNDRAVDIVATGWHGSATLFQNPREGEVLCA